MSAESPVPVHSVAEAYLYVMASRCPGCQKGPLRESGELTRTASPRSEWTLDVSCSSCRHSHTILFLIEPPPTRDQARSDVVNPTSEPSRSIDLLGWLSLFQAILSASEKQRDREAARQLAREAAQCLDEALKFYELGNEMPPRAAFFSEDSWKTFERRPEFFARSSWRERRLKLPESTRREDRLRPNPKRPWWKFWLAADQP